MRLSQYKASIFDLDKISELKGPATGPSHCRERKVRRLGMGRAGGMVLDTREGARGKGAGGKGESGRAKGASC